MKKRWWIVIGIVVILLLLIIIKMTVVITCSRLGEKVNSDISIKNEINKLFTEDKRLVIYNSERTIEIKKGSQGSGFAFSVRNLDLTDQNYSYLIEVSPGFDLDKKCNGLTIDKANSFVDMSEDDFNILANSTMQNPILITFTIPNTAPTCLIPYDLKINFKGANSTELYVRDRVAVVINDKKTALNPFESFFRGFFSC